MWHKYPNSHCSHVVTVDVLDRSVDPQTGVVRTERILGCKQKAPAWIVKVRTIFIKLLALVNISPQFFGGSEDAFVREVSFIDPTSQTMTVTSINLSLSQIATCYERIRYTPSPSSPLERTVFTQSAEIQARMAVWRSVSNRVETWLAERFEQNALKGKLGFSDVLRRLCEGKERQRLAAI